MSRIRIFKKKTIFQGFVRNKEGAAIVESALLFPVLMLLFMGLWDLGNGMLANQKTITAAQVIGDLVAREKVVDSVDLNNFEVAGRLAYGSMPTDTYGIDILSVEFDDIDQPFTLWRETRNMAPDPDALSSTVGLGGESEGVVVVTVRYVFEPTFSTIITGDLVMEERAYLRGRRSPTVERE